MSAHACGTHQYALQRTSRPNGTGRLRMLVMEIVVTEMARLALGPCQALRCWWRTGAWASAVGESYLGLNVDMVFCIKFERRLCEVARRSSQSQWLARSSGLDCAIASRNLRPHQPSILNLNTCRQDNWCLYYGLVSVEGWSKSLAIRNSLFSLSLCLPALIQWEVKVGGKSKENVGDAGFFVLREGWALLKIPRGDTDGVGGVK